MKKTLLWILLLTSLQGIAQYHLRVEGHWNNPNLATNPQLEGQIWNELTGWADTVKHREYVIMGSIDSVYFFDVTNPQQVKLCDVRWGLNRATNRDVETFSHYVYCVSDNAPAGKLQIYDLQYLPDSVHKVYEDDALGHNTHSLFVNRESKRLYMCSNKVDLANPVRHAMDIVSIADPVHPVYIGAINPNVGCQYVHEVYVKQDTAYCSCEYKGLFVLDMTDLNNQHLLGSITPPYPYNGYNHTNWVDSSNSYIAFTDEVPNGLPLKVYEIRSLNDMTYLTHFDTHTGATPHNLFWVGNRLYVSWYQDGVYIFNMDTPRTPKMMAYYDTYGQNAEGVYQGYRGCWGVYPFLPSGIIAASDMSNGLFVLRYDTTYTGIPSARQPVQKFTLFPNPFKEALNLFFQQVSLSFHIKLL
jgi:choice-of-anchor B domain-containing protein